MPALSGPFSVLHGSEMLSRTSCSVLGPKLHRQVLLSAMDKDGTQQRTYTRHLLGTLILSIFLKGTQWNRKPKINRKAKIQKETSVTFHICEIAGQTGLCLRLPGNEFLLFLGLTYSRERLRSPGLGASIPALVSLSICSFDKHSAH